MIRLTSNLTDIIYDYGLNFVCDDEKLYVLELLILPPSDERWENVQWPGAVDEILSDKPNDDKELRLYPCPG